MKSEIVKMNFDIQDSAFIEPHYLALGHVNGIHLYNVLEKDYLKKPPLFSFDVPNFKNLIIWPGGHLWAIGNYDDSDHGCVRYTICEFIPNQPLKPVIKLPEICSSSPYAQPVIVAGKFCYCPAGDPRGMMLKSLDPQTGKMHLLKAMVPEEEIQYIFSTIQGVCTKYWDINNQLVFGLLKEETPLLTQKELKEAILSETKLTPDTAKIVAEYAFAYAPEFFAPAKQPQLKDEFNVVFDLNGYINKFVDLPDYQRELKILLSAISEKGDRTYADCLAGCPKLMGLVKAKEADRLRVYFYEKGMQVIYRLSELAMYLIALKNLDDPMNEFKLIPC